MGETPVFFDYNMKKVEEKGTKFITRLQLSDEKRRITCVLTVVVNGDVLRPMIIYYKKEILNLESDNYETTLYFVGQKMDGWTQTSVIKVAT